MAPERVSARERCVPKANRTRLGQVPEIGARELRPVVVGASILYERGKGDGSHDRAYRCRSSGELRRVAVRAGAGQPRCSRKAYKPSRICEKFDLKALLNPSKEQENPVHRRAEELDNFRSTSTESGRSSIATEPQSGRAS